MLSNKSRDYSENDSDEDYHSSKYGHTSRIDEIQSDYSQRRSYSSTGIIDEKSNRNGQTENGSYDVAPKTPSNAGSDIKKRSNSFVRSTIRSVIPNSQITTMAKRLSQPGHVGQRIELYTNHFQIKFSKQANEIILYQFNIDVEIRMCDGSWCSCKKEERLQALKIIIEQEHFPLVWYDDGKYLYAIENLTLNYEKEYLYEIYHKKTEQKDNFRFLINLFKTYKLQSIFDFIQKRISILPHDLVRILETLFKQTQKSDMITIENESYSKHQRLDDQGNGRGIASGFYQAIVLGERGPTLNINNTFCGFYQNYNLVEFLSSYLNYDICKNGIPPQDHLLLVGKVLKSIWFITSHTNQICRYRLKSFGGPANEHTFTKNENEQITVADYFNDEWKIRLRHPHLSVVELFNPAQKNQSHFVPMELVTVDEWQLNLIPITPEQRAKATKKTVIRPGECYRIIQSFANERRFNQDPCLETFGLTVDVNKMLMLPARILPPPKIIYKSSHGDQGDVIERVQIGERWLNNRFDKTCEIHAWAIVFVSEHKTNNQRIGLTRDFAERIPQVMSKYDIRFNSLPIEKFDAPEPDKILVCFKQLKMQGCEVIFYILDEAGLCIYYLIKFLQSFERGMVIQCINFNQLASNSKPRKMDTYIHNLVEKFNTKVDGVNQLVSLIRALTSPSARSDIFMFFGIDCTYMTCSDERPSMLAITGSKDSTNTQYDGRVIQQFPPKEKIALEIIKKVHIYVGELIRLFSNRNSYLPNKLVFYQIGLDDGSFEKMLGNELRSIPRTCQELYGHNQLPQICSVVVKKRHNTRFFTWDKQSNEANNVEPGTVIDTGIVSPNGSNFYLNSHVAIEGTSRSMLYQVLHDEIGFTSDEIQQLTYYLCHVDSRCKNPIPVPAPVHIAERFLSHHIDAQNETQFRKNNTNIAMAGTCPVKLDKSQDYDIIYDCVGVEQQRISAQPILKQGGQFITNVGDDKKSNVSIKSIITISSSLINRQF